MTTALDGGKVVSLTHRISASSWFYHKQVACNVLTKRAVVVIALNLIMFNACFCVKNFKPYLCAFQCHKKVS